MSAAGQKRAPTSPENAASARCLLADLLHALNQPLTGLQCSMELAVAGRQPADHYIRTLNEGLELVSRMRLLVETLRELADLQEMPPTEPAIVLLDGLLRDAAHELRPIAESMCVRLVVSQTEPLPIRAQVGSLTSLVFRTIESALALCRNGSEVFINATAIHSTACVNFLWKTGPAPQYSPHSRAELGLLLARAGWEHLGGKWIQNKKDETEEWTIRVPLASPISCREPEQFCAGQGDRK